MIEQYEGKLGIFEYDDAECTVARSSDGADHLLWLGASKSVTITGILRSTRRMFADATLPEGFKLYLHTRGIQDMSAMFINARIPDNFVFSYEADRNLELTNMFTRAKLGDNFVMHVNGDVSVQADLCFYSATFAGDFKCKLPWETCTNLHSFLKNAKFSVPVELYLKVPVNADVSEMFAGCAIPDDSYITVQGGVNARACGMFADANVGVNSVINLRDLKAGDYNSAFYNCILQNAVKLLLDTESTEVCTTMFTKAVFPENFTLALKVPYGASVLGALFDTQVPANSNVQMKLANAACLPSEKATLLQKWIQKLAESKYDDLISAIAIHVTEYPEKLEEGLHFDFDNVPANTLKKFISATEQILEEATDPLRDLNLF